MINIIEKYKTAIIHIVANNATGTGFYLKKYNLIITNFHVVGMQAEVVVSNNVLEKTAAKVIFADKTHDLAFLKIDDTELLKNLPTLNLANTNTLKEGDTVVALGHPYDLKDTVTKGIVSKAKRLYKNINYIQFDAAINPGNSGGPVLNQKGEVIGISTFIMQGGDNLGFALKVEYLHQNLNQYKNFEYKPVWRCVSCSNLLIINDIIDSRCFHCGHITPSFDAYNNIGTHENIGEGIVFEVEKILTQLGKNVKLLRNGEGQWDIQEGSALIKIKYNYSKRFISGTAILCTLPKNDIVPIYEFLLSQNYYLHNLKFSVDEQSIVLSFIINDSYFNPQTAFITFENLFKKADEYDNILVEKYGAIKIKTD